MSEAIRKHAIRYPHARTSTLVYKADVERTTKQLQAENERAAAAKRVNEYRDCIGYVSWPRRVLSAMGWRR